MEKIIVVEVIEQKIFFVRGLKVMLDKDLAFLYGIKTIRLREQVKRNTRRFPNDFCFQLDDKEIDFMVSQFAIPSRQYLGGWQPYVFTEQGVAMLSSVLHSERAVQAIFAAIHQLMTPPPELPKRKIGFLADRE